MTTIGVIGLGVMGRPMAGHILDHLPAGDTLLVPDRRPEVAADLVSGGAESVPTDQIWQRADIVVLVVQGTPEIQGLLEAASTTLSARTSPVTVVISSTISPADVRAIDADLRAAHGDLVHLVDAPISGGEVGARAGTLSVMAGGSDADVAQVSPYLGFCGTVVHLGPLGSGEVAKACNQLIVGATVAAIAEASVVLERSGLDVRQALTLMNKGYAGSAVLGDKTERFATHDYSPSGPVGFWLKDMHAYLDQAGSVGVRTLAADRVLEGVETLVEAGMFDADTTALQHYVADLRTPPES